MGYGLTQLKQYTVPQMWIMKTEEQAISRGILVGGFNPIETY